MSPKRIVTTNKTAVYFITFVVIIAAFMLLGGLPWLKGMMHGNRSMNMANWNWAQILICVGIGFILGLLVAKRR